VTYSRAALQQFREQKERQEALVPEAPPAKSLFTLDDVPADAPMDEGIVLGFWNGERFVSREKWLATAPVEIDDAPAAPPIPADAQCVTSDCGGTRVWLVRDGERWLMFAGSRRESSRRKDFASPFLGHAQVTAEAWYGPAAREWER
jgi:hypothetical protein